MNNQLTIALAKGRILKKAILLLGKMGITPTCDPAISRALIMNTNRKDLRLLIVRSTDLPTFVGAGAADIGIVGKDVLLEYHDDSLYEPLDLDISHCRMVLAAKPTTDLNQTPLRVATKYTRTTREYFSRQGKPVEIIQLYGSMEIAPELGLADCIVDLVDTGETLRANGLEIIDTLHAISARLVINKIAMKMKFPLIKPLLGEFTACSE